MGSSLWGTNNIYQSLSTFLSTAAPSGAATFALTPSDFQMVLLADKYPVWIPSSWTYSKVNNYWVRITVEGATNTGADYYQGVKVDHPVGATWQTMDGQVYLVPQGGALSPLVTEPVTSLTGATEYTAADVEAARKKYWTSEMVDLETAAIVTVAGKGNKEDYVEVQPSVIDRVREWVSEKLGITTTTKILGAVVLILLLIVVTGVVM
ncbi:MAG: hypothetical protein PHQ43_09685 [Dehalococcoidales bacterium]|nr:hypothetical protein [Dehalococcoidales bacterium]